MRSRVMRLADAASLVEDGRTIGVGGFGGGGHPMQAPNLTALALVNQPDSTRVVLGAIAEESKSRRSVHRPSADGNRVATSPDIPPLRRPG